MLGEIDERIGLFDAFNAVIPDLGDPVLVIHDQRAVIAQRDIAIALGYGDLKGRQNLRADPSL